MKDAKGLSNITADYQNDSARALSIVAVFVFLLSRLSWFPAFWLRAQIARLLSIRPMGGPFPYFANAQ